MGKAETDSIAVLRASSKDADAVVGIVRDAANWLRQRGSPQWRIYLTDAGEKNLRDHIAGLHDAEVYLVSNSEQVIGTFCLEWSDREIWGDRGEDNSAGYIHTVALAQHARGKGLGVALVGCAERLIAQRNKKFARLDCWAGSPALLAFYDNLGYIPLEQSKGCQLFQKQVQV